MFTPDVARNLAGPAVVESDDWHWTVLEIVSMVLAVAYVPKYSADIRRKGREARNRWGRVTREPSDVMKEAPSRNRPDAFSMIALTALD